MQVRWAAKYLREAGEIAWKPTGQRKGAGILVTLRRWRAYAPGAVEAPGAGGKPVIPVSTHEEVLGSVVSQQQTRLRRDLDKFDRQVQEGREAVEEELRRQRGD
jgi:hypothetical protein